MTATTMDSPARRATPRRHVLSDAATMIVRSLRLATRDPDSLIVSLVLPIMILLLFVNVFGGALQVGTAYVQYATPGVILLCAGYGAANTAIAVQQDSSGGIIDRFRSMPIASATFLVGHVVASVVKNFVMTAITLGVAFMIGFRADAGAAQWLAAAAILSLYVLAITWAATFVGVLVRSPDAAGAFAFVMLLLPYASSAFVPPETMPAWLRGFAEHQPVTPVIESLRGLLTGMGSDGAPVVGLDSTVWLAVAWTAGIAVVFLTASAAAFARQRRG